MPSDALPQFDMKAATERMRLLLGRESLELLMGNVLLDTILDPPLTYSPDDSFYLSQRVKSLDTLCAAIKAVLCVGLSDGEARPRIRAWFATPRIGTGTQLTALAAETDMVRFNRLAAIMLAEISPVWTTVSRTPPRRRRWWQV